MTSSMTSTHKNGNQKITAVEYNSQLLPNYWCVARYSPKL